MRSSSTPGSPCSVWACAAPSRPTPSRPIFIIPPATSLVADASVRIYDCRHTGVKLAAAPISWGVCEVPGWGHQLAADRVIAQRQGLVAALHPHVGTAIEGDAAISRVLRESEVSLCLDTGHAFVGGSDPVAIVAGAGERVAHVHLKDADADLAAAVRERRMPYAKAVALGLFRPLGEGDAGIKDVLSALRHARYDGWLVLEQDIALAGPPSEANDPARDIARSRDFA